MVQVRFLRMEGVGQKGEGYKWNYISSEEGREKVADQTKCWVEKAKWEGGLQYGRLLVKGRVVRKSLRDQCDQSPSM